MKWRVSFDWEPKTNEVLFIAFLVGAAWFATTLAFDVLLTEILDLPAATVSSDRDMAYLLPMMCGVPTWVTLAIFNFENKWKYQLFGRVRWNYCALGLALLLWCFFVTRFGSTYNHRFPADSAEGAAYASVAFPFAVACACLLLALLRRADVADASPIGQTGK